MKSIQSLSGRALARWLSVGLMLPSLAFADGSDSFNDNSKDTTKWGNDVPLGAGVLTETNQRLEFTCNNAASEGDTLRPWILERFPVNANWAVQVDTANSTVPALFGQVNSGGFRLSHPTNADSEIYLELYAVAGGKGFVGNLKTDDVEVGNADTTTLVGDVAVMAAVRMEYDGLSRVATCFYDLDATDGYQWTEFASYGLAGAGGTTANTDWNLSSTQQFSVYVYGYSAGMTVSSGQLYLDNFVETGGVPSGGGPAPVPTGSFGFSFPTANALLTAIASITGNYTGTDPFGSSRTYDIDVAQDDQGKVVSMGMVDGVANAEGGSDLTLSGGAVTTVNNTPTLRLKSSFSGSGDEMPVTAKGSATAPLELTEIAASPSAISINGGEEPTEGIAATGSVSAKVAGMPVSFQSTPVLIPATPDMQTNFSKDWSLQLDISTTTVKGKQVIVASAQLTLPNDDVITYPQRTVKYSTTKGYKLSFKGGTNVTAEPDRLDKKSKVSIAGLTFEQQGEDWVPTGGTISYQFLGQKGVANVLDFMTP
jgi:hypothetical protein